MRNLLNVAVAGLVVALGPSALAQQNSNKSAADAAIQSAFAAAPADWKDRLTPDETMKLCATYKNNPPAPVADKIKQQALSGIQYPADGKFLGDWQKGEAIAQSGYGMRFSDYPPARANGGNCYACHQLTVKELSYGTIGPSLLNYGKLRDFKEAEAKRAYERVYNSHAILPCSNMPRFGANQVLTMEQIRDVVALLMSPDSPVNK